MTEPPPLPARLTDTMRATVVGSVAWFVGSLLLFVAYLLASRPLDIWFTTSVAGWALGLVGIAIFRWQRAAAARRGSRAAQDGLDRGR